jgi:hypothetical protein
VTDNKLLDQLSSSESHANLSEREKLKIRKLNSKPLR